MGVLNTAVWFGATVFLALGAGPAASSQDMKDLLGERNYPYFSGAIGEIVATRYFRLSLVCSIVAVMHLLAEWLYLGKYPQKLRLGLLVGLFSVVIFNGYWLQDRLKEFNIARFGVNARPEQREAANRSYRLGHGVSGALNFLVIGGLVLYLWRLANPADSTRFLDTAKFRS